MPKAHVPEPLAAPGAGPLLRWYRRQGRALPWRGTHDPYRILLSEIMLQQTQVQRVRQAYPRFLKRFPTMRSLARAPLREVLDVICNQIGCSWSLDRQRLVFETP